MKFSSKIHKELTEVYITEQKTAAYLHKNTQHRHVRTHAKDTFK